MRLTGVEPATFGSGGRRSIQLSYRRVTDVLATPYDNVNSGMAEPSQPPDAHAVFSKLKNKACGRVCSLENLCSSLLRLWVCSEKP